MSGTGLAMGHREHLSLSTSTVLIYVKGQILLCHSDVNAEYHQAVHWEKYKQLKSATVFHQCNSEHIFCP